jgi:predicted site-specific integrase-resolvase
MMCVQIDDSEKRRFNVVSQTLKSIDSWLNELRKNVKGKIAVAIELTKGPDVYALHKYSFVSIFPIHELTLARYRQAMFPSGAKDDLSDVDWDLDMMLNYSNKVKPLRPSSHHNRTVTPLV